MKNNDGRNRPRLTSSEEDVLTMIVVGQRLARAGKGTPPGYREIREWMGWGSDGMVSITLDALQRKGYIRRSRGKGRAIEVLP